MMVRRHISIEIDATMEDGKEFVPVVCSMLRKLADLHEMTAISNTGPTKIGKMVLENGTMSWESSDAEPTESIGIGDGTGMDPEVEGVPVEDGGKY